MYDASRNDHLEIAIVLLAYGANVNDTDNVSVVPLLCVIISLRL